MPLDSGFFTLSSCHLEMDLDPGRQRLRVQARCSGTAVPLELTDLWLLFLASPQPGVSHA